VVYRRTLADMPAAAEEIHEALAEGVRIMELTAPLRIETSAGREWALLCSRMELRGTDESGRPRPVPMPDSEFELVCDAVIVAIGQEKTSGLPAGSEWKAVGPDGRTTHPRLFIGGDARLGASTLVKAIADGCRAAVLIGASNSRPARSADDGPVVNLAWAEYQLQRSRREAFAPLPPAKTAPGRNLAKAAVGLDAKAARLEAQRCLHCGDLCQLCVGVCPNRALVAFETVPKRYPILRAVKRRFGAELSMPDFLELRQKYQLVHVVDFCNGCGNCAAFCPTAGAPYKDKPHIYLHEKEFAQAVDGFFLEPPRPGGVHVLRARANGEGQQLRQYPDRLEFENCNCLMKLGRDDFSFQAAEWRLVADPVFDGELLAGMAVLLEFLPLFLHGDKTDV
jgi:putative selenate reductase